MLSAVAYRINKEIIYTQLIIKIMDDLCLFQFQYTSCIYESDMRTMSIHRTKKGAYKAMNKYLNDRFNKSREERLQFGNHEIYDHIFTHEAWRIFPIKVEE